MIFNNGASYQAMQNIPHFLPECQYNIVTRMSYAPLCPCMGPLLLERREPEEDSFGRIPKRRRREGGREEGEGEGEEL